MQGSCKNLLNVRWSLSLFKSYKFYPCSSLAHHPFGVYKPKQDWLLKLCNIPNTLRVYFVRREKVKLLNSKSKECSLRDGLVLWVSPHLLIFSFLYIRRCKSQTKRRAFFFCGAHILLGLVSARKVLVPRSESHFLPRRVYIAVPNFCACGLTCVNTKTLLIKNL